MSNLKPTQDRVQFQRIIHDFKKGEVVVDYSPSLECKVLAVGPKCRLLKKGMKVIIPFNIGMPVQGTDTRICRETDVGAIVEDVK